MQPATNGARGPHTGTNRPAAGADQRGFSLIELLVGIVIMAMMFGMSLPAMVTYLRDHQLLGAANELAGEMRLARQRAATESNNYVFSWNLTDATYTVLDDDNNNGTADTGEGVTGPRSLPNGVTLDNGASAFTGAAVTFLPTGSASEGGELTVTNEKGLTRTVRLIRVSGLVKVMS